MESIKCSCGNEVAIKRDEIYSEATGSNIHRVIIACDHCGAAGASIDKDEEKAYNSAMNAFHSSESAYINTSPFKSETVISREKIEF